MSAHSVLTIRLVGGHPALDLLNTVDPGRDGEDRDVLKSFGEGTAWAMRVGVLPAADGERLLELGRASSALADRAHADLLRAREALRAVIRAEVEGRRVDPATAHGVERAVAAALAHRRFSVAEAPFGWQWRPDDLDTVQHRVMLSAAELLANPARRAARVCAGPDCGWYFLDTSKAGNRRWCSDAGCGGAARVRRLRERRTAER